ncbi:MAG: hypothetical protein HFJ54_09215 [Clostridia bacterium]|nr:hypothetical protein [Clostridia bacterium]
MANLKKRFNEIIGELEKNIKNKEDLDYIKSQVYNISLLFLDEMDKLAELNLDRLNVMIDREKELGKRIASMEKVISNIEKEMYISPECDFEIICPYCNTEFVEDFTDGMKHEVRCPECENLIELDWHDDEECSCTHECHGECDECGDSCKEDNDEEEMDENEDDM